MSKFSMFYDKHKSKVLVVVSLITIAGICYGVYDFANRKGVDTIQEVIPVDKNYVLADYIITGNDIGLIKLLSVKDAKEVNSLDLKAGRESRYIYTRDNDLTKLYSYGTLDNSFYELKEEGGKLSAKVILELKDTKTEIIDFKVMGDNVITLTSDKKTFNKISTKDGVVTPFQLQNPVENWLVSGDYIIYTEGNIIHTIKLSDGSEKQVDVGEKTVGLYYTNGEIIAFNKFGSGKNTSIVLKINPADLYIKNMFKFENANIVGLPLDSDDNKVYFVDLIPYQDSQTQLLNGVDLDKMTKDIISINPKKDTKTFKYDAVNTIATKGYVYSMVENGIEILDTKSQQITNKLEISGTVFMPILK